MINCEEWTNGFVLLYQNITSNQAPGLNAYEMSKFLTESEKDVVIGLYNGSLKQSFEETEELTMYLAPLVSQMECTISLTAPHIVANSKVYELPDDLLFRTLEMCTIDVEGCGEMQANVVPVTQDEFWRTYRNPFKGPNKRRVLRLTTGKTDATATRSELVSDSEIVKYVVRYIKKPEPIILEDLPDGLTIDGESQAKTCKLPEQLHNVILEEAVRRAKAVWIS